MRGARGQTNLPAVAVALLLLTTVAGVGIAMAETAFASADRDPDERRVAVALSERLVSLDAPLTTRANVLNGTATDGLTAERLRRHYPVVGEQAVRVRLGNRTLVDTGVPAGSTTVRRIVLVRRAETRRYEPRFGGANATTLPRRTGRARLDLEPGSRTAIETVRANGRVVLRNTSGLRGERTIDLSRYETTRLAFETNRTLSRGDVEISYVAARTSKATLEVTVGD
jgi:hypothetical protein